MKRFLVAASFLLTSMMAFAQPPAGNADPGDYYGEKITPDGAIAIADLPARLKKAETVDGKIRAKVLDVCPKKGCWLQVQVNDTTTAFVKMKDYAFFAPTAIKGKTVVLDAEASMLTTSVDDLKHYAKDAKKSKAEIDAITAPKKEIRLMANGIVVVE